MMPAEFIVMPGDDLRGGLEIVEGRDQHFIPQHARDAVGCSEPHWGRAASPSSTDCLISA